MKFTALLFVSAMILVGVGCDDQAQKLAPPATVATVATNQAPVSVTETNRAQAKLQTLKLYLGTREITAEIAATLHQVTNGLMFRTNMAEMEGMLFVFARPHQAQFWMRNTLLPLSCAYIDPEGTVLEIHDMKPLDETGIPAATDQIQYVLEMNQGWFQRNNVTTGAVVRTARGTFHDTFFRR